MQIETNSNLNVVDSASTGGSQFGQSSTDLCAFWGVTPVVQQTGYSALTDTSGGSAASGTGLQALSGTFNSTIIANSVSTLAAAVNNILVGLRANGILK